MSSDAYLALLSAAAGFLLATLYDAWKTRRSDVKRDRLVLNLLNVELLGLERLLGVVKRAAQDELAMTDKQILEEPLPVLESELWEILRLGIPKALLSDETLSDDLHRLHLGVRHMSEVLAAREAWRREQQPAFVMRAGIERYDNQLVTHVERLSPLREKAHRSLLAHGRTLRRQ